MPRDSGGPALLPRASPSLGEPAQAPAPEPRPSHTTARPHPPPRKDSTRPQAVAEACLAALSRVVPGHRVSWQTAIAAGAAAALLLLLSTSMLLHFSSQFAASQQQQHRRAYTEARAQLLFPTPAHPAFKGPKKGHLPKTVANVSMLTADELMMAHQIPHFLIIGVQKCGTSALYFSLCLHPNITCAAHVKEPFFLSLPSSTRYLNDYASTSMSSVRRRFHLTYAATCFDLKKLRPGHMTMEASTTYFESDTAFDIISSHLSNSNEIKLLVILREPVSRAYSHYQHDMRRKGPKPGQARDPSNPFHSEKYDSFVSATEDELAILRHCRQVDELHAHNGLPHKETFDYEEFYHCVATAADHHRRVHKRALPGYLLKGLYYGRLRKWLQRFPARLHVVLYDAFRFDPVKELSVIQRFLGLPHYDYDMVLDEVAHEYQEGSRYEKIGGAEVRRICDEFAPHNDLLAHYLGTHIPWNEKLAAQHYVVPL